MLKVSPLETEDERIEQWEDAQRQNDADGRRGHEPSHSSLPSGERATTRFQRPTRSNWRRGRHQSLLRHVVPTPSGIPFLSPCAQGERVRSEGYRRRSSYAFG